MIHVRKIVSWEHIRLGSYAQEEVEAARKQIGKYQAAERMYLVSFDREPALVCGISRTSMVGTGAEIWIMLCAGVRLKQSHLRFLRRGIGHLLWQLGVLRAAIAEGFAGGERLARFLGFRRMDESLSVHGVRYHVHEVRLWQWH